MRISQGDRKQIVEKNLPEKKGQQKDSVRNARTGKDTGHNFAPALFGTAMVEIDPPPNFCVEVPAISIS